MDEPIILSSQEAFVLVLILIGLVDAVADAEEAGVPSQDANLVPAAWGAAIVIANRLTDGGDARRN